MSEELVRQLAEVPAEQLNDICQRASRLRAKNNRDKIPQELKDSLVRKYDRLDKGQTTSIIIKPEIRLTITVNHKHRDYEEIDYKVELLNPEDRRAKEYFELFELGAHYCEFEPWSLNKIEPHLSEMVEQERKASESFQDDYYHIQGEFGVNAYDLIDEIKRGSA